MKHIRAILLLCLFQIMLCAVAFAQAPAQPTKEVKIYGQKIVYVEAGSPANPPVILLHGLGGDASHWAPTIPALAEKYHVFAPDQIGFGKSDKPLMNYRVGTLVEFLNQFYKQVGIQKASLVGNSLGGWTAARFALAYPDKVEKIVLVDAAGFTPKRWGGPPPTREALAAMNAGTVADLRRLLGLVFYNKAMQSDFTVEMAFTEKMKRGDGLTINAFIESILRGEDFLDEDVKGIKAPTLVVWGKQDGLTPLAMGEAFAKDIPNAQLVAFDQCGHVPQLEKAAEFNAAVLKFLAGAVHSSGN